MTCCGAGRADVRASDDDGSSAADTGEPPAEGPAGQSSESSPLGSGAATPLSAPALPVAANGGGGAPAGCPNPAEFPTPEGLLERERGLGGAEAKRALSLQLGLGAYQRSQEDIAWVPDAGAPRVCSRPVLEAGSVQDISPPMNVACCFLLRCIVGRQQHRGGLCQLF